MCKAERAEKKDTEYVEKEEDIKRKQQETWREKLFHSLFPLSAFFFALWMVRMALTPFWGRPWVTNSNHTMSELSHLCPRHSDRAGDHYNRLQPLQMPRRWNRWCGAAAACLPPMSSIPSFPRSESLLMKELLSLRRGRGAIKMKTNVEVGRTGRWEGRMSHL